jgi:hypothetical protein
MIFLAIALISGSQQPRAKAEIHLIPQGYVGWVTIAYRAPNGEAPAFEGDALLYRIPPSGVLITGAEPNVGSSPAWTFFVQGADQTRIPIRTIRTSTVHDTPENRADPDIGIFYMRRGYQRSGRMQCDVAFDQYFVGTKAQLLSSDELDLKAVGEYVAAHYRCP